MAGSFPTSVTTYTNPGPADATATAIGARTHDQFHADNNDDLEQVMTKLGTGASTATAGTVLRGTGTGVTAFGQIVSGDIQDGTIATADLLAGAISQGGQVVGSTSSPANATGTPLDIAEMTVTPTLIGGGLLIVLFETEWMNSLATATTVFNLLVGGTTVKQRQPTVKTNNEENIMTMMYVGASVAGATNIKAQFYVSAGTATILSSRRSLMWVELKK